MTTDDLVSSRAPNGAVIVDNTVATGPSRDLTVTGPSYRYLLWRTLPPVVAGQHPVTGATLFKNPRRLLWVMLNPSRADGDTNDPTLRKCMGFATRWGYSYIEVVNLFALRATDPQALGGHPVRLGAVACASHTIVGPKNDAYIIAALQRADDVVCAWGATRVRGMDYRPRIADVERHITTHRRTGSTIACLGVSKHGCPKHPLYVAYEAARVHYLQPAARVVPT